MSSQIIRCALCTRALDDALIMSCDHNLCLPCAGAAVRRAQLSGNMGGLRCDLCRAYTAVEPASAAQLLESISGSPNPMDAPGAVTYCAHCETSQANVYCSQCNEQFCTSCANNLHSRGRFASHNLRSVNGGNSTARPNSVSPYAPQHTAPMPTYAAPSTAYGTLPVGTRGPVSCREHPDEQVQYFCLDCEQPCVCAECVVHGIHKDHQVLNLKKAYPVVRAKVEEFLYSIGSRVEELGQVEQRIDQHRRELQQAIATAKLQLSKAFEDIRQRLSKKESELSQHSDAFLQESLGELDQHMRAAREKVRSLDETSSKIRAHINTADHVALLNYYAEVRGFLQQTLAGEAANTGVAQIPESATQRVYLAVEHTNAHVEALQNLQGTIQGLKGLDPAELAGLSRGNLGGLYK